MGRPPLVAVVTAGLGLALALAGAAPAPVLAAAVAFTQLLLAARWATALDVPGAVPTAVVGVAVGVAADVLVLVHDATRPLGLVAPVLGLGVLAALLQQLARRDGRAHLTAGLTATAALVVCCGLGAAYVALRVGDGGRSVPVVGAAAAAATATVLVVPVAGPARAGVRLAVALGLAALAGVVVAAGGSLQPDTGALIGLGCGGAAAVATVTAARVARPDPLVTAALPLLLAGPAAAVLARLLTS